MKKFLSITVIFTVIVSCIFCLNITTHAETGTVLYENTFESGDISGWQSVYSGSANITEDEENSTPNALFKRAIETYDSPSFNLYSKIKAMGAGTYHFQINVMYRSETESTDNMYMMIRGNSSDENSFIKKDAYSPNYFARISSRTFMRCGEWRTLTGSIKVLESDITRNSGHFDLCVDGIPVNRETFIYIDDVKIVKLSETGITNSDFSDGLTGWVSWQENEAVEEFTTIREGSNLLGKFIRVSTYGSVACNVDQILSYYGDGDYNISFDINVEMSQNASNNYVFYLTSNYSDYHKWIAQREINPGSGTKHFSFDFSVSMASLDADNKQVHFRIQSPGSCATRYTIDNVILTPKRIESATIDLCYYSDNSAEVVTTGINTQVTDRAFFRINTIPLNAPRRFTYSSSNKNVATVGRDGALIINGCGVTTLTAVSRTGNVSYSKTISINQGMVNGFVGFGQETSGQCWAASARMLSTSYANKVGISIDTSHSLATDIVAIGKDPGQPQNLFVARTLCNYYLGENMPTYNTSPTFDGDSLLSKNSVISLIDNNTPIYAGCHALSGSRGHVFVIYGYYYSNNTLYLTMYDPNENSQKGGVARAITYDDFIQKGYKTEKNTYFWREHAYLE